MNNTKLDRIAFLLGSGISRPAGLLTIDEITAKILSGKGITKHPNKPWVVSEKIVGEGTAPSGDVWRVTTFLKRLKAEVDLYYLYRPEHTTNYEDLYHLAVQLLDDVTGRFHNPALREFRRKIISDIRVLIRHDNEDQRPQESRDLTNLSDLSFEAMDYIAAVVRSSLRRKPTSTSHLKFIECACQEVGKADVFTVNHDTVLEDSLRDTVQIYDGFDTAKDDFGLRRWNCSVFDHVERGVCLIKLHGSLDWFHWTDESLDGVGITAEFLASGLPLCVNVSGRRLSKNVCDDQPVILIGTVNKMVEYLRSLFLELHFQFHRRLIQTNLMVVSGYGFGDDGVNMRIREWMHSSKDRRMLVIDPNPARLRERFEVTLPDDLSEMSDWGNWEIDKRLKVVGQEIQKLTWDEIKKELIQ